MRRAGYGRTRRPQTPQDLQAHACLGYSYWAAGDHWPLQGPAGEVKVAVNSLLHANNGDVLREAAIAGMGVILQPDFLLEDALADGRLVRAARRPPIGIFAVYTSRSHLAPKVQFHRPSGRSRGSRTWCLPACGRHYRHASAG